MTCWTVPRQSWQHRKKRIIGQRLNQGLERFWQINAISPAEIGGEHRPPVPLSSLSSHTCVSFPGLQTTASQKEPIHRVQRQGNHVCGLCHFFSTYLSLYWFLPSLRTMLILYDNPNKFEKTKTEEGYIKKKLIPNVRDSLLILILYHIFLKLNLLEAIFLIVFGYTVNSKKGYMY